MQQHLCRTCRTSTTRPGSRRRRTARWSPLDADGAICVLSYAKADVVDVITGWFAATGTEVVPPRLPVDRHLQLESRSANSTLKVMAAPPAPSARCNVTATDASGEWVPDGAATKPTTSNVNFLEVADHRERRRLRRRRPGWSASPQRQHPHHRRPTAPPSLGLWYWVISPPPAAPRNDWALTQSVRPPRSTRTGSAIR
ncbi:MAG: hypothetical protein R2705_16055 [Ilumatobacteraceae bacterium]